MLFSIRSYIKTSFLKKSAVDCINSTDANKPSDLILNHRIIKEEHEKQYSKYYFVTDYTGTQINQSFITAITYLQRFRVID